jgi:putative transposase
MDAPSSKVQGQWRSLSRAVDTQGQPSAVLLTEQRATEAALHCLQQAIRRHGRPETITRDGSAANAAALKSDNEAHGTALILRQVHYVTNSVAQAQRAVKRVTRRMVGFKAFEAAQDTRVGIERRQMSTKKQLVGKEGDEGRTAADLFYSLAA